MAVCDQLDHGSLSPAERQICFIRPFQGSLRRRSIPNIGLSSHDGSNGSDEVADRFRLENNPPRPCFQEVSQQVFDLLGREDHNLSIRKLLADLSCRLDAIYELADTVVNPEKISVSATTTVGSAAAGIIT